VNGMEKRYFYKKTEEVGSQGNTLYNVVVEYMEYNTIEVLHWFVSLTRANKLVKELNRGL
jgi:ferritin